MKRIDLRIPPDPEHLDLVQVCSQALLAHSPLSPQAGQALLLAAMETVNNSIRHAHAGIEDGQTRAVEITWCFYPHQVEFRLRDQGHPFDPARLEPAQEEPDPLAEGGRGLFIMQNSVDEVTYRRESAWNHWCLRKNHEANHGNRT